MNQLGGVRSDEGRAKDHMRVLVHDELRRPGNVIAQERGARGGRPRHLCDRYPVTGVAGLTLREPDARHRGIGENHLRHRDIRSSPGCGSTCGVRRELGAEDPRAVLAPVCQRRLAGGIPDEDEPLRYAVATLCLRVTTLCLRVSAGHLRVATLCLPIATLCLRVSAGHLRVTTLCLPIAILCLPIAILCLQIAILCLGVAAGHLRVAAPGGEFGGELGCEVGVIESDAVEPDIGAPRPAADRHQQFVRDHIVSGHRDRDGPAVDAAQPAISGNRPIRRAHLGAEANLDPGRPQPLGHQIRGERLDPPEQPIVADQHGHRTA